MLSYFQGQTKETLRKTNCSLFKFINIINKRYQCNGMRHHNNFLPNLFLAPAGGSNPTEPYPNPAVQT